MCLFREISNLLYDKQETVLGKYDNQAIKGMNQLVEDIVQVANLDEEISKGHEEFGKNEYLLYLSDSYRDHFFHPFHTFLLGFFLLNKLNNTGKKHLPFDIDDNFLQKWILTSLWHDITYAAEKGPEWLKGYIRKELSFEINADQDWGPLISNFENNIAINKLISKFTENRSADRKIMEMRFNTWINNQIHTWKDHGILSSIYLIKEAEKKKWKIGSPCQNLEATYKPDFIEECALAIALHNFHMGYNDKNNKIAPLMGRLSIEMYPLAWLLAFCDTSQEWGRPQKNYSNNMIFRDILVKDSLNKHYIQLNIDYDSADDKMKHNEKLKKVKKAWLHTNIRINIE